MIFKKKMDDTEVYKKVLLGKPHCILGKSGLTGEFINHVLNLLKRYKVIKVKVLKSVGTKSNIRDIAAQIAEQTGSYLIDLRGKTFILSKKTLNK